MQKLIDTSTAFYGAGNAPTVKLFSITSGAYSGRRVVLYSASPSTIKMSVADPPYLSWSAPVVIASDAADYPVTGHIDAEGNVYLVYSAQSSLELLFRKLSFNMGEWSVGSAITIYNDKENYFPTIIKDISGKLTVCWTCYDSSTAKHTLRAKQSTSDGAVWGAGPSDAGTALTAGSSKCFGELLYLAPYIYLLYTDDGTKLAFRSIPDGGALWDPEVVLFTGSGLDDRFSAAAGEGASLIGVALSGSGKLWYMEFDGNTWSGAYEVAINAGTPPLLLFNGAIPYVLYGVFAGGGQSEIKARFKSGAGFSAESDLCAELSRFAFVLLYDADGSPNFQNLTTAAGDTTPADVFHSSSTRLFQAVGDSLYLGGEDRFASVQIALSTPGDANAAVSWSYFNGSAWATFTPLSGAYNFDSGSKQVRLWNDSTSAPSDWQKIAVDQKTAYWIKVTVTSAFATAPIGSQITPLSNIIYLNR